MPCELLMREGRINQLKLRNRIITGPMERNLANRDGTLTQRYIDYLVERARGGASLIHVESSYVDVRGMGHLYQVGCHGDHVLPGLRRLAEAVHAHGASIGLEIYMGGRQTPSHMSQRQPIAPSAVRCQVLSPAPTPREMTEQDIDEVIGRFADAARRIVDAGLDTVLLHGAHGYLLNSFLSPYSNRRSDKYGGSAENRARFALELLSAIRRVVGPAFPIGYRISAEEYIEGGLTIADSVEFCRRLADAGIDLIDVSGGIYESAHTITQGPEWPKGGFVRSAAAIKKAVGEAVPVSVANRLNDPEFAETSMREHALDFVTLSRAWHADPHYARKVKEDRVEDILPCVACHHCTNLLEANQVVVCAANPHSSFETARRIRPVARRRRVVVIGGGPAGMHAARILARQGNQVSLLERTDALGGQIRYSSRVAEDYGYLVTYLAQQMDRRGVEINLNTKADADLVRDLDPDVVVVATGAGGGSAFCPIQGTPDVFNLFTALDRPDDDWEDTAIIAGGQSHDCFVALYLAGRGVEVHIIEPGDVFCEDKMSPGRDLLMRVLTDLPIVHLHPETTVEEIGEGYVMLQNNGTSERLGEVGSVVIGGRVSNNGLYEELITTDPDLEVYNIGDSVNPREIIHASHEAVEVAEMIRLRAVA